MGVTNRNEPTYKHTVSTSAVTSSTESLHLQRSDSENSVPQAVSQNLLTARERSERRRIPLPLSTCFISKSLGRRRMRRIRGICELEALKEEDEYESIDDLTPEYHSSFTTVLSNPEAAEVWNKFSMSDEQVQREILNAPKKKVMFLSEPIKERAACQAYQSISCSTRSVIKKIRSVDELQRLEIEIMNYFDSYPSGNYVRSDKSSFQRLLIHGIAQYYCLKSTSFDDDGKRTIHVSNPHDGRIHCNISLATHLEQIKKH